MGIKIIWKTIKMLVNSQLKIFCFNFIDFLVALKPSWNENSNRRSWESSKLSSALEEEENQESEKQASKEETVSLSSNKSPEFTKKEEKEGMFSKYFRKGECFKGNVVFTEKTICR